MSNNQIKKQISIPVPPNEKQEIKLVVQKIVELIRKKHL